MSNETTSGTKPLDTTIRGIKGDNRPGVGSWLKPGDKTRADETVPGGGPSEQPERLAFDKAKRR